MRAVSFATPARATAAASCCVHEGAGAQGAQGQEPPEEPQRKLSHDGDGFREVELTAPPPVHLLTSAPHTAPCRSSPQPATSSHSAPCASPPQSLLSGTSAHVPPVQKW